MRGSVAGSFAAAFLLLAAVYVHGLVAWFVCAPLVAAYPKQCGWWRAALVGGIFGLSVALGGDARWVASAARLYFHLQSWPAALVVGALALVFGGGFGVLLGVALRCVLRLPSAWSVVAVAATWATWESLVITFVPYYPWVSLAATQAHMPSLLQIASVVGQAGLSFVIAATGTAFGWRLRAYLHRDAAPRYVAAGVALFGLVAAYGWMRLTMAQGAMATRCPISVVDAGIASADRGRDAILGRYRRLTRRAMQRGASVVIWPESALPGDLQTDLALRHDVRELLGATGTTLIAGGPRSEWTANWKPRLFNSAYLIEAAAPLHSYDKQRLVPFAEYWPRQPMQRPRWLATQEIAAGHTPGVFNAGGCHFGILICFEVEQPRLARALVRAKVDAILVLSNDAELPRAAVHNEIVQVQLRAVETGMPVIRAANRGGSVVVDRYGNVVNQRSGGILSVVPPQGEPARAVTAAPLFGATCLLGSLLAIVLGAWWR